MAKRASKGSTLTIRLVRSPIGYPDVQKKTVRALGLHRINQTVQKADSPAVRGMIEKVSHLVMVEE